MTPPVTTSLYDRATIIAGRSLTRSKAPDRLRKAWATHGDGAVLWDTNGRSYIDMVCGLGAISLGYGRTPAHWHGVYSLPHISEIEAAEAVLQYVAPWASSVRFVKTGSEATHAAYRIAKAATGRDYVAMFIGAYHGWHEWSSGGDDHVVLRIGRMPPASETLPAAVFVEPLRFTAVDVTWLKKLRVWCDDHGTLLVFDSMIYGGRWALGGTSQYFGVRPDLECFGKAFGNGAAVAFVVGCEALAEHGELVSGTFSGETSGLEALCDVLNVYTTEPVIDTLWARGRQLKIGFEQVVPRSVAWLEGEAPLQRICFADEAHRVPFKDAMAERGVLVYPDWLMTMAAHTPEQIDQVIAATEASAKAVMHGG